LAFALTLFAQCICKISVPVHPQSKKEYARSKSSDAQVLGFT